MHSSSIGTTPKQALLIADRIKKKDLAPFFLDVDSFRDQHAVFGHRFVAERPSDSDLETKAKDPATCKQAPVYMAILKAAH